MTNLSTNINQTTINRQPSQQNLTPEQRVYLYNDTQYTGTLMRPIEKTYPPRWTVALDRGGYEAVNTHHISPLEPQPSHTDALEIPFSDSPEPTIEQEIIALKRQIQQLQQENRELKQENQRLTTELKEAKNIIRRAKDISPLMRISLRRVLRLARNACMDIKRTVGGWILKMGDKARKFRRLADIWDILSQDDWCLSDIFAPDKLIPLDKIKPPRPYKRPTPPTYKKA